MRRILFDVLEVNIAVSIVILLVCLLEGKLRKRYGAGWLKIVWFVLAIRLLIPYNFSLPFTELRFFNVPGFEQEEMGFFVSNQEIQGIAAMGLGGVSGTEVYGDMAQSGSQGAQEGVDMAPEILAGQSEGQGSAVQGSHPSSASDIVQGGQSVTAQDATQNSQSTSVQNTTQNSQSTSAQNETQNSQLSSVQNEVQDNPLYPAQNASPSGQLASAQNASKNNQKPPSYSTILMIVWLLGIGAGILYFVLGNISFYIACKKTLQPVKEGTLLESINILQKRMLGKVKLAVYQSSAITSPMLVGLVSPKLVLPAHKQEWEAKELEYIVAHELCHYRNKDLWLKLLMMLAWCLNWFNPVVLLMKKKCFFHIELACDGCVLEGMEPTARREYAGMLVSFAGKRQEVSAFSTNFGDSKKRMKQRIDYALDTHSKKKGIGSLLIVGTVLLISCLLISCGYKPDEVEAGGLEPGQNQMENGLQSEQQTEQSPELGTGPTEAPAIEPLAKPTEKPKSTKEPEPTEEPAPTAEPIPTVEPLVLTEEYELVYEGMNVFNFASHYTYFKYKDTYADLYMRRLQNDTGKYIELSLWSEQKEIWHTVNGDDVGESHRFWQENSGHLTLEEGQCYYVVELDGTVYLMKYCVENVSNVVTMSYNVFGISPNLPYFNGSEGSCDAGSISIYLVSDSTIDKDVSFPIEQLTAFADTVKGYMENGHLVASTLHGAFEFDTSADRDNQISPHLYDIFPWIPELVTQYRINMEGIDSPKKLLTALQNALPTSSSVTMPDVAADGSYFITGDYYSESDESYLTVRMKEDGSYEGELLIANALVADFVGYYDNGSLTAMEIVDYPEQLPCEMEIFFKNGKATVTITADSEWSYPVEVGDTLTLDRNEKPEEFDYLRNAEYPARE